jgi:hypothetical protein
MKRRTRRGITIASWAAVLAAVLSTAGLRHLRRPSSTPSSGRAVATVRRAVAFDVSPPLASLRDAGTRLEPAQCGELAGRCGESPGDVGAQVREPAGHAAGERARVGPASAVVEQTTQGRRPAAALVAHFDGLGVGFEGPQGAATVRNPSDNSLAVGPNHIVQIVNSRLAVFTKKGKVFDTTGRVLYGAVATNTVFAGFGGQCELRNNGDAVVRYDQLAERWLYVMPIFSRPPNEPKGPYSMCYALSTGADPLGPYHRYEFKRPLFPDYPRPAVWPDGYYVPSSTSDDFIQKHACVVERGKMLQGLPAKEQCIVIDGVNFLNNADIDGQGLPPAGAPNIMMAAGGAQLMKNFEDDGIYAWKFHVDWENPANTGLSGPAKIPVAPYHYLCNGQLTSCVPQPDTSRRLDAQGDKIMQRLVYRNAGGHQSIVALHSVNSGVHGGGVRWYEFRLNGRGDPILHQQGTYAPDSFYRWMGSIGIDRQGNIGMGYSFGGTPNYPGQRFAARLADDRPGMLTLHETVLVEGEASQKNTIRWEDYTTTAMDPGDDCTFWYVGDYLRSGAASYSSRIGAFRVPGCLRGTVTGSSFFDRNHDGARQPDEPGLAGWQVDFAGGRSGSLTTDADGTFDTWLPADPAYADPVYTFAAKVSHQPAWTRTGTREGPAGRGALAWNGESYRVRLLDLDFVTGVNFGNVCVVKNRGGADYHFWSGLGGRTVLAAREPTWRALVDSVLHLANADGSRFIVPRTGADALELFQAWLREAAAARAPHGVSSQLAVTALNVAFGRQDGNATLSDPGAGDWPTISALTGRVSSHIASQPDAARADAWRVDAERYRVLLERLNANTALVTPSSPSSCPRPF